MKGHGCNCSYFSDNKSGGSHPKSAGASLRRYNEASLVQHVQDILVTWKDELAKLGYTWEPVEATTDDGYILTLFHITGTVSGGDFTPDKDPVLI